MRTLTLPVLALLAVAAAGCTDAFNGTNLYFDFAKLDPLIEWTEADKALPEEQKKGFCADDAYAAANPAFAQPYEYQAWAMINGGPVRLARFTVRRCTVANNDTQIKRMITTVHYTKDPKWGYADRASHSQVFGVVDDVVNAFAIGSAYMVTDVRLDGATEIFITREPLGAPDASGPAVDQVLMKGALTQDGDVFTSVLEKQSLSGPSGHVTAIVVNRTSAW